MKCVKCPAILRKKEQEWGYGLCDKCFDRRRGECKVCNKKLSTRERNWGYRMCDYHYDRATSSKVTSPAKRLRRRLFLGRTAFGHKNVPARMKHWGVGVDYDGRKEFYEIHNPHFPKDGPNIVFGPRGIVARGGQHVGKKTHSRTEKEWDEGIEQRSGTTTMSRDEIENWIRCWIRNNPRYSIISCNCQHFAKQLYHALSGESL
jgi:hypothetical protein